MTDISSAAPNQGALFTPSTSNGDGKGPSSQASSEDQKAIFAEHLYPDDSFTPEGVYWADLPVRERIRFVTKVDAEEAKKEWNSMRSMMKKSFFSPVGWYFKNAVLPGAGLGLEGYVLFSIGNLMPLYQAVWPQCWKTHEVCNKTWTQSVTYLEIVGIMVGQICIGAIGDGVGRRFGLITDAVIMFLGLLWLVGSWGTTLNSWVIMYSWALFFYGFGVGGEYPMTATAAMENAVGSGKVSNKEDRLHRGRKVTMAFLMQGWGQFFNSLILLAVLYAANGGSGAPPYSVRTAFWTFRVSFAITAVGTAWLIYYRWFKMPLASKQLDAAKKKAKVTGYDIQSLKMTCRYFGPRLIATAGTWFLNDVFFYGNKLFQAEFIKVISPGSTSVTTGWWWNLVNVSVSMVGYYCASFLIDNKLYGRKWMQQVGFFMCFILFVIPGFNFKYFTRPENIKGFQAMYFLSSFFNQFGPNSVTFLIAAEVFPTPVRASAHGFSAAVGKLGALFATVLYNYIDTQMKFWIVPWFGLAGMLLNWLFLPDTTGLDLSEQERRWEYLRSGRDDQYHGVAVHPHHLSVWERWMGVGKHYNPELDRQSKIVDMREDWEVKQVEKMARDEGGEHDEEFGADIHEYFKQTKGAATTEKYAAATEKSASSDDEITNEKRSA